MFWNGKSIFNGCPSYRRHPTNTNSANCRTIILDRNPNRCQLLITNRRHVMTFEMITDHIWGYDYDSVENMLGAIHNIMSRIKQKLRVEPDIPEYISSVRGVGYKFNK